MTRKYQNAVSGTLSSTLAIGGTTMTANPSLQSLITISSPDTIMITLDPEGSAGDPEIVEVTAHSAAANTATIVRAQEGTTAREHLAGVAWVAAVTTAELDDFETSYVGRVPVGALLPYAGTASPDTNVWLLCDGDAVSRTTYAALFTAIGTTFGNGDGSTTFNLPDLRGRVPMGLDNMGGSSANRVTDASADSLGGAVGSEDHTLTASEMPSHTHSINHDHGSFTSGAGTAHSHTMGTHSHTINHNHPAGTTSSNGSHSHGSGAVNGFIVSNTGSGTSTWSTSGGTTFSTFANTASAGAHTHTFDVANFSGSSGSTDPGDTNSESAHTHSINPPNFSGTSGSAGSGSAHNILQPSLALGYLIKV